MNEGWIKLHRQLIVWEWYDDIPTKVAFLHLILVCNHSKTKWRGIELDAGETIKSLSTLAKESGLSMMQWRTSIEKLKSTQSLTERKHGKHRILKLNSYSKYQVNNTIDNTMVTRSQHDGNTMITTDKNEKNERMKRMKETSISSEDDSSAIADGVGVKHELFEFYEKASGRKVRARQKYTARIKAQLKVFTVAQIKLAWRAMSADDFLRGRSERNENGKDFFSLEYALRGNKIDEWLNKAEKILKDRGEPIPE